MSEKKVLSAVLEGRCPRCREGKVFAYPSTRISKFNVMHESCEVCGLRYEVEPGFFYGSMYVSYGISVGIFLSTAFVLYFLFGNPSVVTYIVSVLVVSALAYPFNVRLSRMVMLYVFGGVKYDKRYKQAH